MESAAKLDNQLASLDPTIERYGSTITSDGWSDARLRPILNMLQVYADGVKFLDSVDTSGKTKVCAPTCFGGARPLFRLLTSCNVQNAAYIAGQIGAAVVAAGEHNVDLVVTDQGGGMKQAGDILMERWAPALQVVTT